MIENAIFTQWSVPQEEGSEFSSLKFTNLLLWVLSVHQARKSFKTVELVTDQIGNELLVNQLGLPFTNVKVELDHAFDPAFNHIWALGKLHSFNTATQPFIHIDHDAVLWKNLPNRILNSSICAQNIESLIFGHWRWGWYNAKMIEGTPSKPDYIASSINRPDDAAMNMGIYGGNDLDFIHTASEECLKALNDPANKEHFTKNNGLQLSVYLEQYWTFNYARSQNRTFEFLLSEDKEVAEMQCKRLGYQHFWGDAKRNEAGQKYILDICSEQYPEKTALCKEIANV